MRLGGEGGGALAMSLAKVSAPEGFLDRLILNQATVFLGLGHLFLYGIKPELKTFVLFIEINVCLRDILIHVPSLSE